MRAKYRSRRFGCILVNTKMFFSKSFNLKKKQITFLDLKEKNSDTQSE